MIIKINKQERKTKTNQKLEKWFKIKQKQTRTREVVQDKKKISSPRNKKKKEKRGC